MKKLLATLLTGTVVLMAGFPGVAQAQLRGFHPRAVPHGAPRCGPPAPRLSYVGHGGGHPGHGGWSTAGSILAGVMIGSIMQNACAAPPRREVVYTQTIYRPAPVQYVAPVVQYVQPQPVVQYVQPQPVVQYVQPQAAPQPPPVTETVWIENANGSRTPVDLRRTGDGRYIGPRGEYYMQYPTLEQLRQVYGL